MLPHFLKILIDCVLPVQRHSLFNFVIRAWEVVCDSRLWLMRYSFESIKHSRAILISRTDNDLVWLRCRMRLESFEMSLQRDKLLSVRLCYASVKSCSTSMLVSQNWVRNTHLHIWFVIPVLIVLFVSQVQVTMCVRWVIRTRDVARDHLPAGRVRGCGARAGVHRQRKRTRRHPRRTPWRRTAWRSPAIHYRPRPRQCRQRRPQDRSSYRRNQNPRSARQREQRPLRSSRHPRQWR